MKRRRLEFSIVDFLIITALLMIAVGMFAPHFMRARGKANPATAPDSSAAVQPVPPPR